jgi:uncharacterized protein YceK
MKNIVIIFAAIFVLSGCGGFLQNEDNSPTPYVSPLKVDCMDVTSGVPNCTEPIVFLEKATGIYITEFTHRPLVRSTLPLTLHIDVRNAGDVEFSTTLQVNYATYEYPCVSVPQELCKSGQVINNNITLQPGETATLDIPIQNPLVGGLGFANVVWYRPNMMAGMGRMFFNVQ